VSRPVSWSLKFDEPIAAPNHLKLRTLRDAGEYVTGLPKADQAKPHWRTAAHELMMARQSAAASPCWQRSQFGRRLPMVSLNQRRRRGRMPPRNIGSSVEAVFGRAFHAEPNAHQGLRDRRTPATCARLKTRLRLRLKQHCTGNAPPLRREGDVCADEGSRVSHCPSGT
jgi:hypothetical protein